MSDISAALQSLLENSRDLSKADRVSIYNEAIKLLATLVADVVDAPCLSVQLRRASDLVPNDYNPNFVAPPELDLLEQSIRSDGVTMPVVIYQDGDRYTVIDGFHRRRVLSERLKSEWIPCSEIDRSKSDRMASTIRHNRARGKHQVNLMGEIVKTLVQDGWDDRRIANKIGMSIEELLRLKQIVGAATIMARPEYGRAWERVGGPNRSDE